MFRRRCLVRRGRINKLTDLQSTAEVLGLDNADSTSLYNND